MMLTLPFFMAIILFFFQIVQKGIGYSPEEVTAALSSKDKKIVQEMKGTMRKFQYYLAKITTQK